jgi:hypothetical protein
MGTWAVGLYVCMFRFALSLQGPEVGQGSNKPFTMYDVYV